MNPPEHSTTGSVARPRSRCSRSTEPSTCWRLWRRQRTAPTVAELAERCGINRSTAWRLLATLESHGMVERASASSGYRVGYGAVRLGAAADEASVVRRVRPVLEELSTGDRRNGEPRAGEDREPAVRRPHLGHRRDLHPLDRRSGSRCTRRRAARSSSLGCRRSRARGRAAVDAGAVHRQHHRRSGRLGRELARRAQAWLRAAVVERTPR